MPGIENPNWLNIAGDALQHRHITPPPPKEKPALRLCPSSLLLSKLL